MAPIKDSLILLTHIPKCAGSSFRESVIEPNIDESMIMRAGGGIRELRRRTKDFRYLVGHWPFGIENFFARSNPVRERPIKRVVILRDPIDQMISFYYYHKQLGAGSPISRVTNMLGLVDFYKSSWRHCNLQTQFLAGVFYQSNRSPLKLLNRFAPNFVYRKAVDNLEKYYDFVIVQSRSNEGFKQFAHALGLQLKSTVCEETVTRERPSASSLSDLDRASLAELSIYDAMLYQRADELAP